MTARIWAGALGSAVVPVEPQAQGVLDFGARRSGESAHADAAARIGGQPVDVLAGQPGVLDGGQAGLDGEVDVGAAQPAPDGRLADAGDGGLPLGRGRAHAATAGRRPVGGHRPEERQEHVVLLLEDDLDLALR